MKKEVERVKNLTQKNYFFTIMLLKTMYTLVKTVFQGFFQMNPIKIAIHELSKTIFEIILAFPEE